MFRGLLKWFTARFRDDEETTDTEREESRFVPSALDRSVRVAHGGGNAEAEREIEQVQEKARQIERQQQKK